MRKRKEHQWVLRRSPWGVKLLFCLEHKTWTFAGTCAACKAGRYAGLEGSKGVDAGPSFVKRYMGGPDGTEATVLPQDGPQVDDPYAEDKA